MVPAAFSLLWHEQHPRMGELNISKRILSRFLNSKSAVRQCGGVNINTQKIQAGSWKQLTKHGTPLIEIPTTIDGASLVLRVSPVNRVLDT